MSRHGRQRVPRGRQCTSTTTAIGVCLLPDGGFPPGFDAGSDVNGDGSGGSAGSTGTGGFERRRRRES